MPEPELEAVAYRTRSGDQWIYSLYPMPSLGGPESEPLTPLPAAHALLQERDERIIELESKLARWRPIARAAVLETQAQDERELAIVSGKTSKLDWARYPLAREARHDAVIALSEPERSELLEE